MNGNEIAIHHRRCRIAQRRDMRLGGAALLVLVASFAIVANSASAGDTRFALRFVGSSFDAPVVHWVNPSISVLYVYDESITFRINPVAPDSGFSKELSFHAARRRHAEAWHFIRPTHWPDYNFPQFETTAKFVLPSMGAPYWRDLPDEGGQFEIKEYTRAPDGTVLTFWATFSYPYLLGGGPVIGELRYNATVGEEPPNAAPTLAVPDAVVTPNVSVLLDAAVVDDAKPFGNPLTVRWSKIAGPDDPTFPIGAEGIRPHVRFSQAERTFWKCRSRMASSRSRSRSL